jgi:hypothetical protein
MDPNATVMCVCGGFFAASTLISIIGTLISSGSCDDCFRLAGTIQAACMALPWQQACEKAVLTSQSCCSVCQVPRKIAFQKPAGRVMKVATSPPKVETMRAYYANLKRSQ